MIDYRTIEECVKGKSAFITGGTSGIGKSCVEVFCAAGVNVVTIGRREELGKQLETDINSQNKGQCSFITCDVRDLDRLHFAIDEAARINDGIDYMVNVAGYMPPQQPLDGFTDEQFEDVINTNLRPYFMGCKYALPYIRTAKGSIVNIGSIVAKTGCEGAHTYVSTKGAIEAFSRSLAFEEARNGVRVNEIKPGHINSEIYDRLVAEKGANDEYCHFMDHVQPLGRGGETSEIAYTALFLASDWASFITGAEIIVSGGYELGEAEKGPSKFLRDYPKPVFK